MAGAGCFVEWCSRSHSLPGKASQSELGRGWVVVKTKASCPWLGAHNGAPRSATAELSNAFLFRLRNWQINSSRLTFKYLRQEWEMEFFFPLKLLLNEMQSCFWLEWSIAMELVGLWGWAGRLLFKKIDWLLCLSLCLCLSVSLFLSISYCLSLLLSLFVSLCISLFVSLCLHLSVSLSLIRHVQEPLRDCVKKNQNTSSAVHKPQVCVCRFGVMKDRGPGFWKLGFQSRLHLWFPNCQSPPTPLSLHFPRCEMGVGWAGTHTRHSGTTTSIPHVISRKDSGLSFEIYFLFF